MAISSLWRSVDVQEPKSLAEVSLSTLDNMLDDYEITVVNDDPNNPYILAEPRHQPLPGELGSTSPSPWTSFNRQEYNPKLRGIKGLHEFDRMRKSDATVRSSLRIVKSPVLSAQWFMEPGGTRAVDKRAADFVWKNLTDGIMSISWSQIIQEALLMCDFGYYMFEKVYDERVIDGKNRTIWRKLAPRHPMDVVEWVFDPSDGGPVGVWMYHSPDFVDKQRDKAYGVTGPTVTSTKPDVYRAPANPLDVGVSGIPNIQDYYYGHNGEYRTDQVFIPIEKLIVCTLDREAGNIEGISVLRSAYKHWYYKEQLYKIDAIQKERHGIGIPMIKLPVGYKNEDKLAAEELGRNIRTNERAHIVLPPGWDLVMLKLEGNPVNAIESIEHHDKMIDKNIVGHFIHNNDGSGQNALIDIFLKSTRFTADVVADSFNNYCIPQLSLYNFPTAKPPKLRHRHIGEAVDWRTMSFAIRNFIGAGVIRPDDVLEGNIREELGLPPADEASTREVATPQVAAPKPARVGPPRQTPVGKQRNTQGLPKADAGNDKSGG